MRFSCLDMKLFPIDLSRPKRELSQAALTLSEASATFAENGER